MSTLFEQIVAGLLPATKVFENERILAIEDIHPVAPVHVLIFPKKPIPNLQSLKGEDLALLVEIVQVAQKIAQEKGIASGYRFLTNNGEQSGQTIFHLHFHLIGGRTLGALA